MRTAIVALIAVLAAGCQSREPPSAAAVVQPRAKDVETASTPFFVGRWAARKSLCRKAPWTFTSQGLSTPGHVVCSFGKVRPSSVYHINAICTAEGPPSRYRLRISYAQSANALLVEGGPFTPIGLTACD